MLRAAQKDWLGLFGTRVSRCAGMELKGTQVNLLRLQSGEAQADTDVMVWRGLANVLETRTLTGVEVSDLRPKPTDGFAVRPICARARASTQEREWVAGLILQFDKQDETVLMNERCVFKGYRPGQHIGPPG